jgi:hypothetical protein
MGLLFSPGVTGEGRGWMCGAAESKPNKKCIYTPKSEVHHKHIIDVASTPSKGSEVGVGETRDSHRTYAV